MKNAVNKICLVTGSSRGIGKAVAMELSRRGFSVVVNYKDDEPGAMSVKEEILGGGGRCLVAQGDVTDPGSVDAMFKKIQAEFGGGVDCLVNNAGITRDKTLAKLPPEDWNEVIKTNLTGVYNCTRAALPWMKENNYGRIVSVASVVGQSGAFGQTNYAASKAGIIGFTKSLAQEVAAQGITVNAVCPGYIETQMLANIPQTVLEKIKERIPMRRLGKPSEIAQLVGFLVGEADYITGQAIGINGGFYM